MKVQAWSIGIKELWQLKPGSTEPGRNVHSFGWPADSRTCGRFAHEVSADGDALVIGGERINFSPGAPNCAPGDM